MTFALVTALCCSFVTQGVGESHTGGTIVQFTRAQCEPCKQIKPAVNALASKGWGIQVVDVDHDLHTAELFRVQNLPTLVFVVDGREVDRVVGFASPAALGQRADRLATRFGVVSNQSINAQARVASAPSAPSTRAVPVGQYSAADQSPRPIVRGQGESTSRLAVPPPHSSASVQAPTAQPAVGRSVADGRLPIQQAIRRAQLATVRIRVNEQDTIAYGTGTVVDVHGDEALVLTCGHLFRKMTQGSQLTIDLYTDAGFQTLPAVLIDFMAPGEDSGELTEDIGLVSFKTPIPIQPVPLISASETVQQGQAAFSFGCDHGDDPTRRETRVTRINRYVGAANLEIDGAPAVGRSGGGLFDQYGRLIGVCNGAQPEDNEGIYAATEVVYNQIRRLGLDHLFNENAPQADVVLASASTPSLAPSSVQPASAGSSLMLAGSHGQPHQAMAAAPTQATTSMTCRIVDSSGMQRVVTINNPDPALLSAIENHANR